MPTISEIIPFNGFENKIRRHGLTQIYQEAIRTLTFELLIEETRHANGTRGIRETIDSNFSKIEGWVQTKVGGIDWVKHSVNSATLGVEVQVSGRSDLLSVDILHIKGEINAGNLDVGLIIVPDDYISPFLTDRTPNLRTALKHIHLHAADSPICVISFSHDGIGAALPKMRTNLGRK